MINEIIEYVRTETGATLSSGVVQSALKRATGVQNGNRKRNVTKITILRHAWFLVIDVTGSSCSLTLESAKGRMIDDYISTQQPSLIECRFHGSPLPSLSLTKSRMAILRELGIQLKLGKTIITAADVWPNTMVSGNNKNSVVLYKIQGDPKSTLLEIRSRLSALGLDHPYKHTIR